MTNRTKLLAALSLIVCVLVGFAVSLRGREVVSDNESADRPLGHIAAPTLTDQRRDIAVGSVLRYEFSLLSVISVGKAPFAKLELSGTYRWRCLEVTSPSSCVWEVQISPSVVDLGQAAPGAVDELRTAFSSRHFLAQRDGIIEAIALPSLEPTIARSLSYLAATLQVAHGRGSSWSVLEQDATGTYQAAYTRVGEHLSKMKSGFLDVLSGPVGGQVTVDRYKHEIDLMPGGWTPAEVRYEESLRTTAEDQGIIHGSVATTTITVTLQDVTTDFTSLSEALETYRAMHASKLSAERKPLTTGSTDAVALAGRSFGDLLTGLRDSSEEDPQGRRKRSELFNALTAYLRLEPSGVEKVMARIAAHDPDAKFLRDGLASAGTRAAQEALWSLFDKSEDVEDRGLLLTQLSLSPRPIADSVERLRALRGDPVFHRHSTYGLGTIASQLAALGKNSQANDIVDELLQELSSATTEEEKLSALAGLGNSGSPRAQSALIALIGKGETPAIRGAAAYAQRFIPTAASDSSLAAALADPASHVRHRAANALGFRSPTAATIAGIEAALVSEPSREVRVALTKVVIAWSKSSSEAKRIVRWIATNEIEPSIRRAAEAASS